MNQLNTVREMKGLAILSQPDMVRLEKRNTWTVKSQSGNGEYIVTRKHIANSRYEYDCNCPDFTFSHQICKHIYAVQFSLKLKDDIEKDTAEYIIPEIKITCPYCNSEHIIQRGKRKNQYGDVQIYGCKECNRRFTHDRGFCRMKHDPKIITLTLDLYFKGVSNRKIIDHLNQFYDISICHTTALRWIKKYLVVLSKYVEKNKADVGDIWHSDEMTVFIRKDKENKYFQWLWNIMDSKTRYLLACQISEARYVEDAKKPLVKAKDTASHHPLVVVTDGLQAYQSAVPDVFLRENGNFIQNPHVRLKDFETKPNNNMVERLNGTFRERTKVLRGFNSPGGASDFALGMGLIIISGLIKGLMG